MTQTQQAILIGLITLAAIIVATRQMNGKGYDIRKILADLGLTFIFLLLGAGAVILFGG